MKQAKKKDYVAPACEIVEIAIEEMLAGSITGSAPDSDDSEFGSPSYRRSTGRRGEWGNLWAE